MVVFLRKQSRTVENTKTKLEQAQNHIDMKLDTYNIAFIIKIDIMVCTREDRKKNEAM